MQKSPRTPAKDYQMAQRHLDYYIQKVVDLPDALITADQLREMVYLETGFRLQKDTIRRYLQKCEENKGEAPMEELYRLNPRYFEKVKVKAPNPYGPKKSNK